MRYVKGVLYALFGLVCSAVLLAYATGYSYLIPGVRQTYLRGYKTAKPDNYKFESFA